MKLATVVKKRVKEVNGERAREGGKRRGKDGDRGKEEEGWGNSCFYFILFQEELRTI